MKEITGMVEEDSMAADDTFEEGGDDFKMEAVAADHQEDRVPVPAVAV